MVNAVSVAMPSGLSLLGNSSHYGVRLVAVTNEYAIAIHCTRPA
ncbi:MAG: hypothetical protein ACYTXI_37655 [Nostoc sp.]